MNTSLETVKIYWNFSKKYPRYIAGAALFLPQQLILGILVPIVSALIVDKFVSSDGAAQISEYYSLFGLFIGGFLIGVILNRISTYAVNKLEENVTRDLHDYLIDFYLQQSYSFFNNSFGGSLVARSNRFVRSYVLFTDTTSIELSNVLVTLIFSSVALAFFSPIIALLMFVMTLVVIAVIVYFAKERIKYRRAAAEADTRQTAQLSDTITNVHTAKTFANEQQETDLFGERTKDTSIKSFVSWDTAAKNGTLILALSGVMQTITLYLLLSAAINNQISIGVFLLGQIYMFRIIQSFFRTSGIVRNLEAALGDAHEMTLTLQTKPEISDAAKPRKFSVKKGAIEFDDVEFIFSDKNVTKPLFNELDIAIEPGQKIGLIGPSGGGKSTITKLLLRFYDINSGSILIDGQNIAKIKQHDLRASIAYVPQESILFHRTLRDNIRYGRLDATDKEVEEAAKRAHATDFINELPEGFDTFVGERGVKLSGGQRQRIAIARAILKDAPILVLDEATSALDSESEGHIQAALEESMKGRTSIVIAHRLSTIQKLDRIIVLAEGEVVEDGTHKELIELDGLYANLWSHQSGGFIQE